ncbi:hypothetical protein CVT25_002250 [Psilocybe cyanescens]|uniref:Uncharacterized protein n=1 Tax=Psilocybe cyanescens TaxID=93625 RepID=A0A409X5L3_PSICY|nr:hypothetical protein CVT25_002250 [Psilocybe cyanescens]
MPAHKSAHQHRAVLPTSYMVVFLLIKHHMAPSRKGFSGIGSSGYGVSGKKDTGRGMRSGLRTCAWA